MTHLIEPKPLWLSSSKTKGIDDASINWAKLGRNLTARNAPNIGPIAQIAEPRARGVLPEKLGGAMRPTSRSQKSVLQKSRYPIWDQHGQNRYLTSAKKTDTFLGRTYLQSPYKGVPPPYPHR